MCLRTHTLILSNILFSVIHFIAFCKRHASLVLHYPNVLLVTLTGLHLFMPSSAYRKPQLHSYPMSTHLMIPSRALLPQQKGAPPPKRSTLLLWRFHLWHHQRLTQKHPSRTRPVSCMRGLSSCHSHSPSIPPDQEKSNINSQHLITARMTQIILSAYIPPNVQQLLLFVSSLYQ